jgi:hypothetical protein
MIVYARRNQNPVSLGQVIKIIPHISVRIETSIGFNGDFVLRPPIEN